MDKLPSLSKTEFLILELLTRRREMYGLEMVKENPRLKRGTIYVLLGRIEEKGFIASKQLSNVAAAGLPKRVYSITAAGVRAHRAFEAAAKVFDWHPAPRPAA